MPLDPYGCDEIGLEAEMTVEDNWEDCHPLESIFGTTGSEIVEGTIKTATEETECVGIKAFSHLIPGEDRDLIATCATVCYWCCCETIKKVSPLIANATINLLD